MQSILSYTYCLGLPVVMWAAIKYWAGASERSPVEVISLYGYQSTVWILVAVRDQLLLTRSRQD